MFAKETFKAGFYLLIIAHKLNKTQSWQLKYTSVTWQVFIRWCLLSRATTVFNVA